MPIRHAIWKVGTSLNPLQKYLSSRRQGEW